MILYHADTFHHLHPGMELSASDNWWGNGPIAILERAICSAAFKDGVSHFGSRVLLQPKNEIQAKGQYSELMAEYVRLAGFPNLPSRFRCVFAARSVEAARKWSAIIAGDDVVVPVYAIECSIAYIADAQKLDLPDTPPYKHEDFPAAMLPPLSQYWRSVFPYRQEGQASELPSAQFYDQEEILVPLPARVLYEVPMP